MTYARGCIVATRHVLKVVVFVLVCNLAVLRTDAASSYHLVKTIKASGSQDTWDFQTIDQEGRWLPSLGADLSVWDIRTVWSHSASRPWRKSGILRLEKIRMRLSTIRQASECFPSMVTAVTRL